MKKKYKHSDIIKMVSEKTGYHEHNVAEIYTAMEEIVTELLLSANEQQNIEIRLLWGLGLYSNFVSKHNKRMPDGSIKEIDDSLSFQAKFTRFWKQEKNRIFKDTRKLWARIKRRENE